MQKRLRLIRIAWLAAAVTPLALAADITIAGPQGHSATAAPRAGDSTQQTIPYWQYKQQQAATRGVTGSRSSRAASFRYGSSLLYRPGMIDRSTFRYHNLEFRMRRYDNLRGRSHRGRFEGRPKHYEPGTSYTKSFGRLRNNRPSKIRYGFQRE